VRLLHCLQVQHVLDFLIVNTHLQVEINKNSDLQLRSQDDVVNPLHKWQSLNVEFNSVRLYVKSTLHFDLLAIMFLSSVTHGRVIVTLVPRTTCAGFSGTVVCKHIKQRNMMAYINHNSIITFIRTVNLIHHRKKQSFN
jgi:hypothetical protein